MVHGKHPSHGHGPDIGGRSFEVLSQVNILPSEASWCKHIGPYRIAKRVLWDKRFVASATDAPNGHGPDIGGQG